MRPVSSPAVQGVRADAGEVATRAVAAGDGRWSLPAGAAGLVVAVLLAAATLLSFPGLRPIRNPDETRDAEIAREFAAGDWSLVPRLNGHLYFNKPPLFHQTVGLVFLAAGGPSDAAARFAAGLFGVLAVVATGWLGEILLGRGRGLLAAVMLLGLPFFVSSARTCTTDIALTTLVTLSLALLLKGRAVGSWRWTLAGGAVAGVAALSKQVHGLLFPFLVLSLVHLLRREGALVRRTRPWWAFLAGCVPVVAWVLVLHGTPSGDGATTGLEVFLGDAGPSRFGETAHHAAGPHYYLILLLRGLPWILAAAATPALLRGTEAERERVLVPLCWVGGMLVALTLASGKRDTYLLPLLPGVALLGAAVVDAAGRRLARGGADRARGHGPAPEGARGAAAGFAPGGGGGGAKTGFAPRGEGGGAKTGLAPGGDGGGAVPRWARLLDGALAPVAGLRRVPLVPRAVAMSLLLALGTLLHEAVWAGPEARAESGAPLAHRAAALAAGRPLVLFRAGKGDVGQFAFPLERTFPTPWTGDQLEECTAGRTVVLLTEKGDIEAAVAAGRLSPRWLSRWTHLEDGRAANTIYSLWEVPPEGP